MTEQQSPKRHRHVIAKIFLAIGVLDIVVTTVMWFAFYWADFGLIDIVRWTIWIGLPAMFITGTFDKE